jgi:hypothetical protein
MPDTSIVVSIEVAFDSLATVSSCRFTQVKTIRQRGSPPAARGGEMAAMSRIEEQIQRLAAKPYRASIYSGRLHF